MQKLILFFILLCCLLTIGPLQAQEMTAEEMQEVQEKYFGNRDYWEAAQYDKARNMEKSQEYYQKALNTFLVDRNWLGIIYTGRELTEGYAGSKDFQNGLNLADSLLNLIATEAPKYYNDCYLIYDGKSSIYLGQNLPQLALESSLDMLKLLNNKYGHDNHLGFVDAYSLQSLAYRFLGKLDSAIYYMDRAYNVLVQQEEYLPKETAVTLYFMSSLEVIKGNYNKAIDLLEESIDLALKDFENALYNHQQALIYEKNDPISVEENPTVISYEGDFLMAQNNPEKALEQYKKAEQIFAEYKEESNQHVYYDFYLFNIKKDIARAYRHLGQLDSAEWYYQVSIDFAKKEYQNQNENWQSSTYHEIADFYLQKTQLDSALLYNQKALNSVMQNFTISDYFRLPPIDSIKPSTETYNIFYQKTILLQALAANQQEPDKRYTMLQNALAFVALSDDLHLNNLKKVNILRGAQSKILINESIKNYRQGLSLAYMANALIYDKSLQHKEFYYTQKMKAQQLWLILLNSEASSFGKLPKVLLEKELDLLVDIQYYEQKVLEARERGDMVAANQYENENLFVRQVAYRKLVQQMETDYPEYYESKYNFIPETETSLQPLLNEDELLIEYVFADSALFVFTLSQNEPLQLTKIPLSSQTAEQIESLHKMLQNSAMLRQSSREKFIQTSHALYQQFLAPIETQLASHQRLIIIGDG